jgi:hypothetical protein
MAVKRVAVQWEGATTEQEYRSGIATVVVHRAAAAIRVSFIHTVRTATLNTD